MWVGVVLGVGYLVAGIGGWIADATDGDGSDLVVWLLLLVGGGILVLASLYARTLPPAAGLALGVVGALAGALAIFWSIVGPLLALAFCVLLVRRFRRGGPVAAA